MEKKNMYKLFKKIIDNYYAGNLPPEIFDTPENENKFAKMVKRYKDHVDKLSENSPYRIQEYRVVSEQFPPIGSDIEKNFLLNHTTGLLYNPIFQRSITVAITYDCSCNCKQCYRTEYINKNRKELSVEDYKTVFKKITDIGAWHVDLTGGEPFEHPKFFDIIDQIPKDKATSLVATNGIH